MAGVRPSWTKPLAVAALLMVAGAVTAAFAQSSESGSGGANGSLAGRLTDLYSAPLNGATVVVRNEATGAEARTTTAKNGAYRFTGLEPGEYTLEAVSEQLGRGRVEGIVVAAGHEARVQAAMRFELAPSTPVEAAVQVIKPATPALHPADKDLSLHPNEQRPLAGGPESAGTPALHPTDKDLSLHPNEQRPLAGGPESAGTPVATAPLAAEPRQPMAMSGRGSAELAREMPAVLTPVVTATLPEEPLLTLPLMGRQLTEVKPGVTGSGLAVSEAAGGAVQAAVELNQPQPRPARANSQDVDPVTPVVTTTVTAAGGASQTSLRGAGQLPAETTMDGASTRLAFGGAGGSGPGSSGPGSNGQGGAEQNGMGQAWAGGRGSVIAEAAIREVRTAAGNAEAEGARTAGGRVNVETQSGGNGLHGQGFIFDRQNNWGARNPFTQWVTETGSTAPFAPYNTTAFPVFDNFQYSSGPNEPSAYGPPESYTPPDHEMTWGIGVGSKIRRDKLFWFAALDSYHRNDPGLSMVKHPYLLQPEPSNTCANPPCTSPTPTGFFANPSDDQLEVLCGRLELIAPGQTGTPKACTNAAVQALPKYSCMLETLVGTSSGSSPNCPSGWPLAGLLGPAPRTAAQWVGFGRIDWQAAERHRFTLEGIGATWNSPGGGLTRVEENYGNHSFGSSKASEEWLLGRWEAFLTPNLLAVTQGSAGRNILEARPSTPSAFEQTFLAGNAYGQLPQIVVDNRYGFTIGNPSRFGQGSYPDERLYQAQESVDWIRGSLLVKAGFDLSHNSDATSLLRNQTGTYTYSNVENFVSDALVFGKFGLADALDPYNQHNCDETGTVWRDSGGGLRGLGYLPCYSYYSQTMGPTDWHLSTNDWAGYVTAQWQPKKLLVFSAGLRWEREQLPPPIAKLNNPELPLTEKLPSLGNNWGPRLSMALGNTEGHWPVLRLGYGMYYGRTENATIETALTQTGSPNGDLNFFMRPTDDEQYQAGGAPPFPHVLTGPPGSVVKPGAVEFAPNFHNPEVHQAVVAVEETLPGRVQVTASAMVSLGRRLPISIDTNLDLPTSLQTITYNVCDQTAPGTNNTQCGHTGLGPIKATQITVPFYASWPASRGIAGRLNPDYQQITEIMSRANSTYEAAMVKVVRYGRRGLSLHAHYTYAHAMDWNPNESMLVAGSDVLDPNPADFSLEYGTSNLDIRHSAAAMVVYEAPWKLRNLAGKLGNGWMVSGIGQFRSGLPYTMRTSGSLAKEFTTTGAAIVGLGPGMNGSGGDNRVYGTGSDGHTYNVGRNTYRYPATWKADLRVGKSFDLGQMRKLELLVESFNLFNHQNVTEIETTGYYIESGTPPSALNASGTPPSLNYLTGLKINTTTGLPTPAFGQPLNINATDFYRERQIQVGLRMRF